MIIISLLIHILKTSWLIIKMLKDREFPEPKIMSFPLEDELSLQIFAVNIFPC